MNIASQPSKQQLDALFQALERGEWRGPSYYAACGIYFSMFTLIVPACVVILVDRTNIAPSDQGSRVVLMAVALSLIADMLAFRRRQAVLKADFWSKLERQIREGKRKSNAIKIHIAYWITYLIALSVIAAFHDWIVRYAQNETFVGSALDGILVILFAMVPLILLIAPLTIVGANRFYENMDLVVNPIALAPWYRGVALIVHIFLFFIVFGLSGHFILSDQHLGIWPKIVFHLGLSFLVVYFSMLPWGYKVCVLSQSIARGSVCGNSS